MVLVPSTLMGISKSIHLKGCPHIFVYIQCILYKRNGWLMYSTQKVAEPYDLIQVGKTYFCRISHRTGVNVCFILRPVLRTLEFLMRHLSQLATFSYITNMHSKNLAIVWAPNLLRSDNFVTVLLKVMLLFISQYY